MINVLFDIISQYNVMIKVSQKKNMQEYCLIIFGRFGDAVINIEYSLNETRQKNPVVTDFAKVKTVVGWDNT